ncbi:MAG: DUF1343 domain-containing protein [Nitrospirae bacterium CG_4_9_14_3_um_filter_53_35]|nr:MAG: hypothetical protein AUK29_05855 [Nitrospirae bacterium CG2_30_53_67]PIS37098.1 MAG: DUF1343 domain-containing protein [Nitrospirae bacterium CG08_land_8_20_14_0_20_52_24]PIW85775.1 MAG: DUF1343 domain-containing protein [Nitrospirae bacterium CG_4_8_14_3_um_filter_50_41]PIX85445.1 MAG: DUF1343 domain-containing protein [Nitrospirae bacterium CG_4_10_14_3_um_filter_53_41]PJA77605.1 MAG: DUF1343 domain-containing protein [Nitrospirae bacterium CG_4_9_14_3_um_filter_53_35]
MVHTGLQQIKSNPPGFLKKNRIGLLVNPASVDSGLVHSRVIFGELCGRNLKALFAPQHGIFGEKQDNMMESPDSVDRELGIPVFSLYSDTRKPTPEMMNEMDILVIDLQNVGTRVYTFIYTMAYCLQAAGETGRKVVVLDRPNPIGGLEVEGNLLKPEFASFVGMFSLPMRHGMTIGELAQFFNREMGIGCDLTVVPMLGWRRGTFFQDTGLPWVIPSPNLPTPDTALVYPGQVLLEGTNISEGRGTTRPFECFGAPYIEVKDLGRKLQKYALPGLIFREHHFLPTFNKWNGKMCHGFQIHVTDRNAFRPYRTTLAILQSVISLYPGEFQWRKPPYEYEEKRLPIDILTGDDAIRRDLEGMKPLAEIEEGWRQDLDSFKARREQYLLYAGG